MLGREDIAFVFGFISFAIVFGAIGYIAIHIAKWAANG
jgi:hypothetical protein